MVAAPDPHAAAARPPSRELTTLLRELHLLGLISAQGAITDSTGFDLAVRTRRSHLGQLRQALATGAQVPLTSSSAPACSVFLLQRIRRVLDSGDPTP